jgi:murein DD-endopeptidase MepM/ murein hydrolase activator NlpD
LRPDPPRRHGWTKLIASAVGVLAVTAGVASAGTGGVGTPPSPRVTDVRCIEACAGLRRAAAGSRIELSGHHLRNVVGVRFPAAEGGRLSVEPTRVSAGFVRAIVPAGAESGKPVVVDDSDARGTAPVSLTIVAVERIDKPRSFKLARVEVSPDPAFYDGMRDPTLTYAFRGDETDIRIELVDSDGRAVDSWVQRDRRPYVDNRARWNGERDGGGPAPNGRYKFRVGAIGGAQARSIDGAGFHLYDHIFPLRAPHGYGDGYGAGRGHQGQDVFAHCGSPIVAARGGRVTWKRYQSAAGNYVVIDGGHDHHDYMYAHMREPASVHEGQRVHAGQRIGRVGQTGNATGCHLHFEYWSDHWWNGGRALPSVTRVLRKWDRWS